MFDTVIHLPEFSLNGKSLSGALPLSALPRLRQQLPRQSEAAAVTYHINGGTAPARHLYLSVTLSLSLSLVCQRCLEPFDYPLHIAQRFWTPGGALPAAAQRDGGGVEDCGEELENGAFPLKDFLTDEILLSLPAAPAHDLSACAAARHIVH